MSPLRAGLFYGGIGALVALVANSYPLYLDPEEMSGRLIAAVAYYRPLACLALYALLAALAAFEMRPNVGVSPGVPYRSLLVRDGAVAGATAAVAIGATLVVLTFSQATVFAEGMRDYAREAAPKMRSYVNERRLEIGGPAPPPVSLGAVEAALEPPTPFRAVHSLSSSGLRLIFLLFVGAAAGALRGSLNRGIRPSSRDWRSK